MNRTEALKRPFAVGVGLVLLLMVGIGVAINKSDSGRHRPEGIAERWLSAVSDTTRKGVTADGRKRAEKIGPGVAYATLLPADPGGKGAFDDLQVGKAIVTNGIAARVPFALHQHNGSALKDTVTLAKLANGDWHVTAVGARKPGEKVPSEGGAVPSKASGSTWLVFVAIALAFGLVTTRLVDWAGPAPVPSQ